MKKNIISALLIALALSIGFSSCEDMLEAKNERHGDINSVVSDTLYGYWGILKSLQNIGERYVILGECRGDLVDGTEYISDSIHAILAFDKENAYDGANRYLRAADYYHVINSCNAYITNCDTMQTDGQNRKVMIKEYAQVCAIRAWVYLQLVQVYGEVPYYTKPMTSTAEMEDFWASGAPTVNASNLKDKEVVTKLIEVRNTPIPNYDIYGLTTTTCHSTQCIFPANLVLGDIFLLEGSKASCAQAAEYYYDFLNSEYGGSLPVGDFCTAYRSRMTEEISYLSSGWINMFTERQKVSNTSELVTVIPSSTNKLWGIVQRGVNELFGFEPSIEVQTSGTDTASTTSASIRLAINLKHQLELSKGYKALGEAQTFETYIGQTGEEEVQVLEGASDARIHGMLMDTRDDEGNPVEFVMKQNPNGGYCTTYPVIYRKGNIWLRFAEAINRAGFPGYAFAILKSGVVNNGNWFPTDSADYVLDPEHYTTTYTAYNEDSVLVERTLESPDLPSLVGLLLDSLIYEDSISAAAACRFVPSTYTQWPDSGLVSLTCNYISMQEMRKAKVTPWMTFDTRFFNGSASIVVSNNPTEYSSSWRFYQGQGNRLCNGIHWRGCGLIMFNERNTTYNYVDQINRMLAMYEGAETELTREEIYDEANEDLVILAIEDLICDEMALETGVEGNRFFDLMRIARHRGDNDFLASRVAQRSGTMDPALRSKLLNEANWYLPLPIHK